MKDLRDRISSLTRKIEALLADYHVLEDKNAELVRQKNELQAKLDEKASAVVALEDKVTWLRLNGGDGISQNEQKEINSKINRYVKEIDKCIAMLQ